MRALTIRQPWASLIATGAKAIETRGWKTSYRGDLLIHAGASAASWREMDDVCLKDEREQVQAVLHAFGLIEQTEDGRQRWPSPFIVTEGDDHWPAGIHFQDVLTLPLGAVVAVARLADVVPIVTHEDDSNTTKVTVGFDGGAAYLQHYPGGAFRCDDQIPLGDFSPGRYAWLLEDVRPLTPVPAKGRQGLWTPDADLIAAVA